MITSHLRRLLVAATLLLSLSLSHAQLLSSGQTIYYSFNDAATAVYDVSGTYHVDTEVPNAYGNPIPVSFDFSITQKSNGSLTGNRDPIMVTVGTSDTADVIYATYKASGKVYGGSGSTHATISVSVAGRGTLSGVANRSLSISLKFTIPQVTSSGLVGTLTGSTSIKGLGGGHLTPRDVTLLPSGWTNLDGSWYMRMDLTMLKKIIGTGTITFNRQGSDLTTPHNGKVSGTLVLGGERASIKFTCLKPYTSSAFTLVVPTDATSPTGIKGKILGQTVREGL